MKHGTKILFLVNNISKTSVPVLWANFIKKNSKYLDLEVQIINLKGLIKQLKLISDFDIIHGHHTKSMFVFLMLNILFRKKSVYTIHGSYLYLSKINQFLTNYIFKKADKVVFVSKILYDQLPQEKKDVLCKKHEIILNGVDYSYSYQEVDVRHKYNIGQNIKIFFHPARFVKEKNHVRILQAFKPFSESHPEVLLVLAGDGPLLKSIREELEALKMGNRVKLIGLIPHDEIYNFLEVCHTFLMPSLSEGLNVSFLEAFSKGTNILVSNIPQFTFPLEYYSIVPEASNIIFVDPHKVDSIKSGLERALNLNLKMNEVNQSFSLGRMVSSYCKIYKELE